MTRSGLYWIFSECSPLLEHANTHVAPLLRRSMCPLITDHRICKNQVTAGSSRVIHRLREIAKVLLLWVLEACLRTALLKKNLAAGGNTSDRRLRMSDNLLPLQAPSSYLWSNSSKSQSRSTSLRLIRKCTHPSDPCRIRELLDPIKIIWLTIRDILLKIQYSSMALNHARIGP